jgi:hypothetical protein
LVDSLLKNQGVKPHDFDLAFKSLLNAIKRSLQINLIVGIPTNTPPCDPHSAAIRNVQQYPIAKDVTATVIHQSPANAITAAITALPYG